MAEIHCKINAAIVGYLFTSAPNYKILFEVRQSYAILCATSQ